ncbi:uncharacterized protein LOC143635375 [Bidens hawaiensis]|uniref:uncharacterized protein LOC143635375 n=1 Tax=Bidens hawaiensis TaxID=980011 RepID=UPI004049E774
MLAAFFETNRVDETARQYLYKYFPKNFTWNGGSRHWNRRKQRPQRGRIVSANPAERERYYLRLLLSNIEGPTSFEDLRTLNGVKCLTFRRAALEMGLIENDDSLLRCITEASLFQFPKALKGLFATILVFCKPGYVRYIAKISIEFKIWLLLRSGDIYNLWEFRIVVEPENLSARDSLNCDQKIVYDEIMMHVDNDRPGLFFIDGLGGTGKTFVYKALLAQVRSHGLIAFATASSGAAANNMPEGRTAHSRFKIPIYLNNNLMCKIKYQSGTAELIRSAKLIIWDEASMAKRQAIEVVDRTLQDIIGVRLSFGEKIMVMGGDFRQVLPVIKRGT